MSPNHCPGEVFTVGTDTIHFRLTDWFFSRLWTDVLEDSDSEDESSRPTEILSPGSSSVCVRHAREWMKSSRVDGGCRRYCFHSSQSCTCTYLTSAAALTGRCLYCLWLRACDPTLARCFHGCFHWGFHWSSPRCLAVYHESATASGGSGGGVWSLLALALFLLSW